MKTLFVVVISLTLVGCQQRRFAAVRQRTDSTVVYSSSAIKLRSDTVWIDASLKCDSMGQVYIAEIEQLVGNNARLSMTLDSIGRLRQQVIYMHDTIFLPTKYKAISTYSEAKNAPKPRKSVVWVLFVSVAMLLLIVIIIIRRK